MADTTQVPDYYFFVLMRTDLASMNPGKAVAQGTHAASDFEDRMRQPDLPEHVKAAYAKWRASTGKFGTTVTLGVNWREMAEIVTNMQNAGFHANIIHDPTYPIQDGAVCHLIPLDTCGPSWTRMTRSQKHCALAWT
jgi:peptidyl-tRNA hydrolase